MAEETIRNLFEEMAKATPPGEDGYGADRYVNPTLEEIARFLLERGVADPMRARIEYGDCGSHDLWVTYDNEAHDARLRAQMTAPFRMNLDDIRAGSPSAPSDVPPLVPTFGLVRCGVCGEPLQKAVDRDAYECPKCNPQKLIRGSDVPLA